MYSYIITLFSHPFYLYINLFPFSVLIIMTTLLTVSSPTVFANGGMCSRNIPFFPNTI